MSFNLSYSENKDNIIKLAMKQRDSVRNVFVADFDTTHEKACKMSKAQFLYLNGQASNDQYCVSK